MSTDRVVRSSCGICQMGCGVLIHVKDGKVVGIEGDPDSPINRGAICGKGLASPECLYHPDRLKHPLKKIGNRGEGRWQQISWDEALNSIANELVKARDNHGPEYVVAIRGAHKGLQGDYLARFANAFGTPNIASMAPFCFQPAVMGSTLTYGLYLVPDYEYPPDCIVIWGTDLLATNIGEYGKLVQALDRGTRLIVIDPTKIGVAERADIWVRPRPGSDLALALGMINVIINEGLYDEAFVDKWTVGFDELRAHVQGYSPEKTEETTWIPADIVRQAARLYATSKPACIKSGNAIETNLNSFQTARAISILRAITGNLGVPGGELKWSSLPLLGPRSPQFSLQDNIPADKRERRVSLKDNLLPIIFYALPQRIVEAILRGDPYPLRVAYIQGCNLLLTYPNAHEVYRALRKLDFIVVVDMFLTPTAELADIVLPVATFFEFDSIFYNSDYAIAQVQQRVVEKSECWSDYRILSELAKRLGLGDYFWDDEEQVLDAILKPAGLTFEEFKKVGVISGVKQYRIHEQDGFNTPSSKVELYSSRLEEWGFEPLPTYHELPETSHSVPELANEYPLVFTSRKPAAFCHSEGRQIAALRGTHPEPIMNIHPETATKLGIIEGDWVYIETKRGRIRQKANLTTDIDPRVVVADYAWWFPEQGPLDLYGWAESNINILTDNKQPYNAEMGSANLRGILCKVYKM